MMSSHLSPLSDIGNLLDLDADAPVRLKDWSAQDFSNIYVRFRPHLEKHARKFVSNTSIVEEVVQDAFLYLLTALPDLDSEAGVLRFLKWKTRLLCLDILRAQAVNPLRNSEPLDDTTPSQEPELSVSIERADDAAIVRLALAKLSPRHRQAIVATVFEEKVSSQVANEMGLSENAFRQLLLRARKSFRTIFVGEAEAADMSVSEALSLAAKRHRLRIISGSSLIIILITSFSVATSSDLPQLASTISDPSPMGESSDKIARSVPEEQASAISDPTTQENASNSPIELEAQTSQPVDSKAFQVKVAQDGGNLNNSKLSDSGPSEEELARGRFQAELASEIVRNPLQFNLSGTSNAILAAEELIIRQVVFDDLVLVLHLGQCGAEASPQPCKLYFEDSRDGRNLVWLAQTFASTPLSGGPVGVETLDVAATDFLVGDFSGSFGNVAVDAPFDGNLTYLRFKLEIEGLVPRIGHLEVFSSEL